MMFRKKEYPQSYYGLLAILSLGPQTGYDIRKELEGPEIFYWKESYGNIYPMLKTLENDGLIDKHDSYVKTKKKVIYQLNEIGRTELNQWLEEPATLSRFRVEILMKIRFGESSGVSNLISQVEMYRDKAVEELAYARGTSRMLRENGETISEDLRLITSLYFEKLKESNIQWCDQAIEILKKWKNSGNPNGDAPEILAEDAVVQLPRREPPLIE